MSSTARPNSNTLFTNYKYNMDITMMHHLPNMQILVLYKLCWQLPTDMAQSSFESHSSALAQHVYSIRSLISTMSPTQHLITIAAPTDPTPSPASPFHFEFFPPRQPEFHIHTHIFAHPLTTFKIVSVTPGRQSHQ